MQIGGHKFQCKEIEGGGAKLQCKPFEGGKISVHSHLKAVLNPRETTLKIFAAAGAAVMIHCQNIIFLTKLASQGFILT